MKVIAIRWFCSIELTFFGKRVIGKHGGTECWIMSPQELTKCRLYNITKPLAVSANSDMISEL